MLSYCQAHVHLLKEKKFQVIFQKGQYSFASKQFFLGSEQHPASMSGAAPEHAAASAALGAFRGTTQPCLEKIDPAQEASCAKYMVIFRKQVNSYKAP